MLELTQPEELQNPVESENENDQKEAALRMKRRATVLVHTARMQVNYIVLKFNRFDEHTMIKV